MPGKEARTTYPRAIQLCKQSVTVFVNSRRKYDRPGPVGRLTISVDGECGESVVEKENGGEQSGRIVGVKVRKLFSVDR